MCFQKNSKAWSAAGVCRGSGRAVWGKRTARLSRAAVFPIFAPLGSDRGRPGRITDADAGAGRSSGSLWLLSDLHSAAAGRMGGEPQEGVPAVAEGRAESAEEEAATTREGRPASRTTGGGRCEWMFGGGFCMRCFG